MVDTLLGLCQLQGATGCACLHCHCSIMLQAAPWAGVHGAALP